MEDLDINIYDLPSEGEDTSELSGPGLPSVGLPKAPREDTRTDKERFDEMYREAINVYEDVLRDPDLPPKEKLKISEKLLEMYGQLGKQNADKVYNVTLGADYMETLKVARAAMETVDLEEPLDE